MGLTVPPPPINIEAERIKCAYCGTPKLDTVTQCPNCGGYEVRFVETHTKVAEWVEVTSYYDSEKQYLRLR